MKTIFLALGLMLFSASVIMAQKTNKIDTASFKVSGVCDMCKERIENASLIKGVKFNDWEKETGLLTVIYKPKKVTEEELHQAVAAYGHDTEKVSAKSESYKKLPMCCEYREGQEVH